MVRYSERQACITAIENALEDNLTSRAIVEALGAHDEDSSDEADTDSSSDEEDFNTDLLLYLQAVHSQQYFGPRRRLALAPDNSDWLMNQLDDRAFKQEFRMSHSSFIKLVERVSGNAVFQNHSNIPSTTSTRTADDHTQAIRLLRQWCCHRFSSAFFPSGTGDGRVIHKSVHHGHSQAQIRDAQMAQC
ncbi:hypothetical protein PSTT_13167 [Puccinia striiformis]|uniref:Uncharacterized protein n=1 Tax=Puccinia striiformis TaxID=27350 RepID=A0A2S4USU9_9BASI|nr:hypothetical protein PSTT_13167 [Puccinia striiformis]